MGRITDIAVEGEAGRAALNTARRELVAVSALLHAATKRYLVVLPLAAGADGAGAAGAGAVRALSAQRSAATLAEDACEVAMVAAGLERALLEHVGVLDEAELRSEAETEHAEDLMVSAGVDYLGRARWASAAPRIRQSRWFKMRLAVASVRRILAVGPRRRQPRVAAEAPLPENRAEPAPPKKWAATL